MHRSNCGCGCNTGCNTDPCANCNTRCRTSITSADLTDEPAYFVVLDENLCKKYTELNLIDCAGEEIPLTTPLVTCTDLGLQVCESLSTLPNNGPAIPGTVLVGPDCAVYTVPPLAPNFTVLDTETVDLTLAGSVLSADVILSPDAGNILEVHPNGLYASVCDGIDALPVGSPLSGTGTFVGEDCTTHVFTESPLVANDSTSIDFTTGAPNGHTLTAVVKLDPDPDNLLVITANGLFLDCEAIEDCITAETPITVIDTATVDLTVSGANLHTLQADVRISADPDNDLIANPDGLFFSLCNALDDLPGPVTPAVPGTTVLVGNDCELYTIPVGGISVLDTLTVDLTLSGTVLSADVEISAVAGNLITIRPDGLAVLAPASPVNIVAGDTNCINVTVTESPADNWTVSAVPVISPDAGNIITCTANGLFVPTSTVDIADTYPTYPATCNGLVSDVNGLSAPPDVDGITAEVSTGGNFIAAVPMTNGQVIASPLMTLNIVNPSDCREALLTIELDIPGSNSNFSSTGTVTNTALQINVSHAFNLPGVLVTVLNQFTQWNVNGNTTGLSGNPPANRVFYFIVPPSFVGSYSTQVTVTSIGGADFVTVGRAGAQYSLVTI